MEKGSPMVKADMSTRPERQISKLRWHVLAAFAK